uniref:3-hydroxyacyl-CoA dehydrogenase NAD binding domain-containing protein n=1 Tax=Strigamia maritima TaxID=126957 RepID=T1JK66_STRMM
MLFASVGYNVALYDVQSIQVERALEDIKNQLKVMEKTGFLKGSIPAEQQFLRIKAANTLSECVKDAKYVQECTPEVLEMKINIFKEMDRLIDDKTILASSTSCILPSKFTENLKNRRNVIVSHPVNPPYYVPLVELIPAPWTDPQVLATTRQLMEEIGQAPVTLNKEMDGFVLNRLQYALLAEAMSLLQDGVISAKDIDTVMTEGLGMRWAFLGPFETAHLNAEGIGEYMEKYGPGMHRISKSFNRSPNPFDGPTVDKLNVEMLDKVPLEKLGENRLLRDKYVSALAKLKSELKKIKNLKKKNLKALN